MEYEEKCVALSEKKDIKVSAFMSNFATSKDNNRLIDVIIDMVTLKHIYPVNIIIK